MDFSGAVIFGRDHLVWYPIISHRDGYVNKMKRLDRINARTLTKFTCSDCGGKYLVVARSIKLVKGPSLDVNI
jgi:hypothetical protein